MESRNKKWILADHLRTLIHLRDWSLAEAARQAGMKRQQMVRYATGVSQPNPATLARVLKALGATEDELMAAEPFRGTWIRRRCK